MVIKYQSCQTDVGVEWSQILEWQMFMLFSSKYNETYGQVKRQWLSLSPGMVLLSGQTRPVHFPLQNLTPLQNSAPRLHFIEYTMPISSSYGKMLLDHDWTACPCYAFRSAYGKKKVDKKKAMPTPLTVTLRNRILLRTCEKVFGLAERVDHIEYAHV